MLYNVVADLYAKIKTPPLKQSACNHDFKSDIKWPYASKLVVCH